MRRLSLCLGLALVFGLVGCSTIQVYTDAARNVDFDKYQTYAWMKQPAKVGNNPFYNDQIFRSRMHQAVNQALEKRGYQPVTYGKADFLVCYHAGLRRELEVQDYGYTFDAWEGYWNVDGDLGPWSTAVEVEEHKETVLLIDFVDARSHELIWRGIATEYVSSPRMNEKDLKEIVCRMIERYPLRK